ncbi:hypothetical protein Rhal01_01363 [Rubritalea halochordaticola]|uniref:FecR protein domain-containing protein n=2 Tax=Rubritalea halochordaticola TaxID=714537 RepID=A0ABP9UXK0_9BACT
MRPAEIKKNERAEELIQELEDATISEADHQELMEILRNDSAVRLLYLEHMQLVSLLKQTAEDRVKLGTMPVSPDMVLAERKKGALKAIAYGLAAMLLIGLAALLVKTQFIPAPPSEDVIAFEYSNHASLSVSYDGKDLSPQDQLKVGYQVTLRHGLVRFTFPNGVQAIVEGPSKLKVLSDTSVQMKEGLAWFKVPPEGVGFKVVTETMVVEDLGTEFGVWFDSDGFEQVHVDKGKVCVFYKGESELLLEGQAVKVSSLGGMLEQDFQVQNFRKAFDREIPYMHWDFDDLVDGCFEADGNMSDPEIARLKLKKLFDGKVEDRAAYVSKGRFGGCFSMNGDGVYGETQLKAIGGNTPRTIAAWVRHRGDSYGLGGRTPYCSWGKRESGRLWKVFLEKGDNDLRLFTSAMHSAVYSLLGSRGIDGKWIHIASVYTGKVRQDGFPEVYHYVNGELLYPKSFEEKTEINTDVAPASAMPLRVGAAIENKEGAQSVDGDIDELYIFRGVLSEKQIQKLMLENKFE